MIPQVDLFSFVFQKKLKTLTDWPLLLNLKVRTFWEGHKILQNLKLFSSQPNNWGRFCKIFWPSDDIWTLLSKQFFWALRHSIITQLCRDGYSSGTLNGNGTVENSGVTRLGKLSPSYIAYYTQDRRRVWKSGGGHCVLIWGFTRTFPGNQDATLE